MLSHFAGLFSKCCRLYSMNSQGMQFQGLLLLGGIASLLLSSCGGDHVRPRVTLAELSAYSSIPVTIEGTPRTAYLTDDSCHYSEWAYGVMKPDASVNLTTAYQTSDSIIVVTPYGIIPLDVFSLKLYLGAFFSRTFNEENASIAPLPIQRLVEEKGSTIAVREYLLQPERTYFARVRIDTVNLAATRPVISTDEVIEYEKNPQLIKHVLEISDKPFTSQKPPREATPAYADEPAKGHHHGLQPFRVNERAE